MDESKKLQWEEKYSVGVKLIDDQHKMMFTTINELIEALGSIPTKEKISGIINQLVEYKRFHFATEERYFKEFGYEKTEEHIVKHQQFNTKLTEIQSKYGDDISGLAFELIDFLEDWLLNHLLTADQEYKECFLSHGLK